MKRREFITLLGGAAFGWPAAARAQQTGRVWRVAVIGAVSPLPNDRHDKEATSRDTSEGRSPPVVVHRHGDARKQAQ
jgi:hypothetical protein